MKQLQRFIIWCVTLCLGLVVLSGTATAADVSFEITDQDVTAEVLADGSVKFVQKWRYDIEHINGALLKIDAGKYRLGQYQVGVEDGTSSKVTYFSENNSEAKQTFSATTVDNVTTFKAYYPVDNQTVTFVAEYTLENLVTNYADTAELNRKLIGDNIESVTNVRAKVILPGIVEDKEALKAWAHGAPQGQVTLGEENGRSTVTLTVDRNPAKRFVEIHAIFPTSLTPLNTNVVNQNKKAQIEQEEADQVAKDKASYAMSQNIRLIIELVIALIMGLLPVRLWYRYLKRRRELNPHPVQLPQHTYSLPAPIAPAIISAALFSKTGKPTVEDFTATVADLGRKGYLEITEERRQHRGFFKFGGSDTTARVRKLNNNVVQYPLQKHERNVLRFLFPDKNAEQNGITFEALEDKMKSSMSFAQAQQSRFESFQNMAEVMAEKLVESARSESLMTCIKAVMVVVANVVLGIGLFVIADGELAAWEQTGLLVVFGGSVIASIALAVAAAIRPLRTAEEDVMYQEWHGFAKMLEDIGQMNMRDVASLTLWEEYLVYAISFGLADKVIEQLQLQFSHEELTTYMPNYYVYYHSGLYSNVLQQSVYSSVNSAAHYSADNASGGGGGFSGGSSGGSGGGGGAGAF